MQERGQVEQALMALTHHALVVGSLITKYKRCNKGGCRCTRGELHGPFWYVSQTVGGKTVMRFLRAADVGRVRPAAERAKRVRQLRARLVRIQGRILAVVDRLVQGATMPLERLERPR